MTALLISIFVIYFFLTLFRPHWGIYMILSLLPTYQIRFEIFSLPTTFLECLILILAIVIVLKMFLSHNHDRSQPSFKTVPQVIQNDNLVRVSRFKNILKNFPHLFILFDLFILAGVISVYTSPETLKALGLFKAYILEGVIFWFMYVILIDTKEKFFKSITAVGVLVSYLAIFGIFQFFTLFGLPASWWGPGSEPRRVVSFYTYPNAVALLITPVLAFFSTLLIFYKNIFPDTNQLKMKVKIEKKRGGQRALLSKNILIFVNILGIILLVLTFSRGAWLGYIASIVMLLFFSQFRRFVFISLILGLAVIFLIPATRNRISPIFTGKDPASFERVKLYKASFQIIKESPILGAGLYGFRSAYLEIRESENDEILNYPHNFFLNFWIETGLLGLLSILAILIWAFQFGKKIYTEKKDIQPLILAVFAGFVVILVHGQVDAPFFKNDLAILFWFLLALLPAISMLYSLPEKKPTSY